MTIALIVLAVLCFAVYTWFCIMATKSHSNKTIFVKVLGSCFFLASGIILLVSHIGENRLLILIPAALFLGLVGDGFIEAMEKVQYTSPRDGMNEFTLGGICFEFEHILLIALMIVKTPRIFPLCLVGTLVALLTFAILFKPMKINPPKSMLVTGVLYVATVGLMFGCTLATMASKPSTLSMLLALGGLLFLFSDIVLIVNYFGKYRTKQNIFIINYSYIIAQILICNTLFLL